VTPAIDSAIMSIKVSKHRKTVKVIISQWSI